MRLRIGFDARYGRSRIHHRSPGKVNPPRAKRQANQISGSCMASVSQRPIQIRHRPQAPEDVLVKTIAHSSDSESSRLAYWLVTATAVLVLMFAITEIPWTPDRLAASVVPTHAAPLAVPPSSLAGANASGTGVPDASAVFVGQETSPRRARANILRVARLCKSNRTPDASQG
jgi:hypothetical protein